MNESSFRKNTSSSGQVSRKMPESFGEFRWLPENSFSGMNTRSDYFLDGVRKDLLERGAYLFSCSLSVCDRTVRHISGEQISLLLIIRCSAGQARRMGNARKLYFPGRDTKRKQPLKRLNIQFKDRRILQ
jgi:hypothetical protein